MSQSLRLNNLLVIAGLLSCVSAHAIKGGYADKKYELQSTCRLNVTVEENGSIKHGICSASFIGNKTFATAEHCQKYFINNMELASRNSSVELPYFVCPNSDTKYPVKATFNMSQTRYLESLDLSIMKISEDPKDIRPLELPKNADHAKELMKDPTKCYINGYGWDNDNKSGTLRAAQVVEWSDKVSNLFGTSTQNFQLTKNFGQPGDSGGPMYCLEDGEPKLVGAISGGKIGENYSNIELIGSALDWYHYVKNNDNPDIDIFKSLQTAETKCGYLNECFQNLPQDISAVVKALNSSLHSIKSQIIQGESHDSKALDEVWDAIEAELSHCK